MAVQSYPVTSNKQTGCAIFFLNIKIRHYSNHVLLKLLVALIPQTADDHDAPAITLTHRSTACMWHGNLWKSLQIAAFLPRTLQCYWLFCSTYVYYLYCIVCDYAAPFIERFSQCEPIRSAPRLDFEARERRRKTIRKDGGADRRECMSTA